jgi:hypothetical protein
MLILAVLSLLATPPAGDAGARRMGLTVSSPEAPGAAQPSFRATSILDVQFDAVFRQRLSGDHVLEFKVYTPKGKLYQVLTVPFSGRSGATRNQRRVAGYPRALTEREMREKGLARYHVSARLPVAGTWIMTNSLYGTWRVDAHVDGASTPSATEDFTLAP